MEFLFLLLALSKDSTLDKAVLSVKIRSGDQHAFKTFYDDHYPGLYRFMVSRGMSHDEAEDLVQKAFVMIWEKRSGIDENKSLRAFLFQIAYTRMLNHVEYQSKFDDEKALENKILKKNPETDIDYSELLKNIRKVITAMPEKRSLVFDLCFMKEFTYKEAADTLGVSVKTVENHMGLAFKDMRNALKEIYGEQIVRRH